MCLPFNHCDFSLIVPTMHVKQKRSKWSKTIKNVFMKAHKQNLIWIKKELRGDGFQLGQYK